MKSIKITHRLILLSFVFTAFVLESRARATDILINKVVSEGNVAYYNQTNYMSDSLESTKIDREKVLKNFFKKYNSPLENHAATFIRVADQYGFDYKLMPSISCVESTCAKFYIKENYNPFGWGSGLIPFKDFDEAIEKVAKGLNEIYFSKGRNTVEKIAPVYTPPSWMHWQKNVRFFMAKIEDEERKLASAN